MCTNMIERSPRKYKVIDINHSNRISDDETLMVPRLSKLYVPQDLHKAETPLMTSTTYPRPRLLPTTSLSHRHVRQQILHFFRNFYDLSVFG